jgi:hypothetical protein
MMDVHDASLLLDSPESGDGESAVSATRERFDTRVTPALVLEAARMDANIERMRLRLAMRYVLLHPHLKIKSAKSTEIARRVMKTGQRRERGIVGPLQAGGACKLEIGCLRHLRPARSLSRREGRFAEHQGYLAAVRRMVNTRRPRASA